MSLDRKDYKTAIPQLDKRLAELEKVGEKGLANFAVLKDLLDKEIAERQRLYLKQDTSINTITVKMYYNVVAAGTTPTASTAGWSETVPKMDYSNDDKVLWYMTKTFRNGAVIETSTPQKVQIMDGVFSFINSVSDANNNWTTIDGGKISTGRIQDNINGNNYFDLDTGTFNFQDASGNYVRQIGSGIDIKGSLTISGHSDSLNSEMTTMNTNISNAAQTATDFIILNGDGIKVSKNVSSNTDDYTLINSGGMSVIQGGDEVARFGASARIGKAGAGSTKITLDAGDSGTGIDDIYNITTPDGATAADITLDSNRLAPTTEVSNDLPYSKYNFDNFRFTDVTTTKITETVALNESAIFSSIPNNQPFKVVIYSYCVATTYNSTTYFSRNMVLNFTKGSSGTPSHTESYSTTGSYIKVSATYDGNSSLSVTTEAQKTDTSKVATLRALTVRVSNITYAESSIALPIHKYHGDIYLNSNNYGDTLIGLDVDAAASASVAATSGQDKNLFNIIRTIGWYSSVIV